MSGNVNIKIKFIYIWCSYISYSKTVKIESVYNRILLKMKKKNLSKTIQVPGITIISAKTGIFQKRNIFSIPQDFV